MGTFETKYGHCTISDTQIEIEKDSYATLRNILSKRTLGIILLIVIMMALAVILLPITLLQILGIEIVILAILLFYRYYYQPRSYPLTNDNMIAVESVENVICVNETHVSDPGIGVIYKKDDEAKVRIIFSGSTTLDYGSNISEAKSEFEEHGMPVIEIEKPISTYLSNRFSS